ncbi:hypothetical protein DL96DRAFT_1554013 [Flagelloscypha sp. PMI_526]|nr:hypothetical protein DL96DRAFT_1554013 [Flagelloscypha sp. PMI_526]
MLVDHKNLDLSFPSALDLKSSIINFSDDELHIVDCVFATAGLQGHDLLPGSQAVKVFEGTGLHESVLREIWQISNVENKGPYLSREGVARAIRLMGWAQQGSEVNASLTETRGPLVDIANLKEAVPSPFTLSNDTLLMTPNRISVEGDLVNELFLRSQLPPTQLYAIWELADTRNRGALDALEFGIAIHLIRLLMAHKIISVPTSIPPELTRWMLTNDNSAEPPPLPPKPPIISIEPSELPEYEPRPPLHSKAATFSARPSKPRRAPPPVPGKITPRPTSVVQSPTSPIPRPAKPEHLRGRSVSAAVPSSSPTRSRPVTSYDGGSRLGDDDSPLSSPLSPPLPSPLVRPKSVVVKAPTLTSPIPQPHTFPPPASPLLQPQSPQVLPTPPSPRPQSLRPLPSPSGSSRSRSIGPPSSSNPSPINGLAPVFEPIPSSNSSSSSITASSSYTSSTSPSTYPLSASVSSSTASASSSNHVFDGLPVDSNEWAITETDVAIAERYFNRLDIPRRGWLGKDVIGTILVRSELSSEDLMAIWALVDPHDQGKLTKESCISMMALVRLRLQGHELPDVLPPSLVPIARTPAQSPFVNDSRLSFWLSNAVSPEQDTITHLQTKLDAMASRIEELEISSRGSPSTLNEASPNLDSPSSSRDKGKGRAVQPPDDEDEVLSHLVARRKVSSNKLQRPPPTANKESDKLKKRIDELMKALSDREKFNEDLDRERKELKDQVQSLTVQSQEILAAAEKKRGWRRDEKMKKQIDSLKEEIVQYKKQAKHAATTASAEFDSERLKLQTEMANAEASMARMLIANGDGELGQKLKVEKEKNPHYRMSMLDLERHVAKLQNQGSNLPGTLSQQIHEDLTKENEELRRRAQEMQDLLFVLKSPDPGEQDPDVALLVQDLTVENERLKQEVQQLTTSNAAMTTRQTELQSENDRLKREVTDLKSERERERMEAQSPSGPSQQNAERPPAYEEVARGRERRR